MGPAQPSLVPENKKEPIYMAKSPKSSALSQEARAILNSKVSRRGVFAGAAGIAGASMLAVHLLPVQEH